jgi:hypothetical protein
LDPAQNYQLALFFGKNIQFIPTESPFDKPLRFHPLIPNHIFGHMRNNLHFELGLGVVCGESIALVDEETGESMFSIDEDLRKKVLKGFLLQGILEKVSEQFSETCSCSLIWLDIYDTLTHQF